MVVSLLPGTSVGLDPPRGGGGPALPLPDVPLDNVVESS